MILLQIGYDMTNFKTLLIAPALTAGLLLTGCATGPYRPVVDEAPSAKLNEDLAACQNYAANYQGNDGVVENGAVSGALTGAVFGGIEDAWDGALVGALLGGLFGAATGSIEQAGIDNYARKDITRNCLAGRGHRVLG